MALEKYQEYLAAQVVNDGNPVTYRLLSRALKVQSNVAKQMLYEFHRLQNSRRPGSVHATYLVTGIRIPGQHKAVNGDAGHADSDVTMNDDTGVSSSLPHSADGVSETQESIAVTTITLVQQEQLEDVKQSHESIDAIHVYSLEPSALQDLETLSDCTRRLRAQTAAEDPLEAWKQYGSISNPTAKRRTTGRPPPPTKPQLATTAGMKPATNKPVTLTKSDSSSSVGKDTTKSAPNQPPAPKRQKSDLFKSFAKSQPPQAKDGSKADDEVMMDADDEEDEAFAKLPNNSEEAKAKSQEAKKAKEEREETLRKMMEQDEEVEEPDESEPEVPAVDKAAEEIEPDVEMADVGGPKAEAELQEITTTTNGRRRGRRKVMKKKTTKDAEGFLVTKQEPVWESFSEDDTPSAPPAKRSLTASSKPPPPPANADKGQGGGKRGQGSIMSFFLKK